MSLMAPPQATTHVFRIDVEGRPVGAEHELVHAIVDDSLNVPDMFVLSYRDIDRNLIERAGFRVGGAVTVKLVSDASPSGETLLAGEVTALEAQFDQSGTTTVIRGYDKSHRLFRGRRTETYADSTYSDIAERVATRAGLQAGTIEPDTTIHPHVSQGNISDWQLLNQMASEIGYMVTVTEGRLDFKRAPEAAGGLGAGAGAVGAGLELRLGSNLVRVATTVSSAEQVQEVEVRGWDVAQKVALQAVEAATTTCASLSVDPQALASTFGSPRLVATDIPYGTQAEVDTAAASLAERVASAFAELDAVAHGNPALKAGAVVTLANVGAPFDGTYTITTSRHVFDPLEGYTTWCTVSGKQERSLLGLAAGGNGVVGAAGAAPRIPGVVTAIVTDTKDPEHAARVKVKFPWLSDTFVSPWARTAHVGAGNERGAVVLPEVNDEVLVAFEQGDLRRPFVLGGLFNGQDVPPGADELVDGSSGEINVRMIRSREGHAIKLFDKSDESGLLFITADEKHGLVIDQSGTKIRVRSDGNVIIEAKQDITIKADGKLEMEAAEISMTAQQGVTIDGGGGNVEITAGMKASLQGAQVEVKGSATADLKSDGILNINGSMVMIN